MKWFCHWRSALLAQCFTKSASMYYDVIFMYIKATLVATTSTWKGITKYNGAF